MKKTILLIGGGGYIGNNVAEYFLEKNYKVKIYDNFIYNNEFIKNNYTNSQDITFITGDINDSAKLKKEIFNIDYAVILAGLVGDPITKKYPKESIAINLKGIKNVLDTLNNNNLKKVIFISTCSNYGFLKDDEIANEDYPLKPLSLYAEHKVEIEKYIMSLKGTTDYSPTILRFATAFGLSSRMRFDLSVNEFTYELANGKELIVYDENTWRPYCHVKDFSLLIEKVLDSNNDKTHFEIFNAGSDINHATKKNIIDMINNYVPNTRVVYSKNGNDPRNYRVNFGKAREILSFNPNFSIKDGISELIKSINDKKFIDVDTNRNNYGNYVIDYKY
mgnify:FL=1|tara:strand:+ start:2513 stop:3514 length:1002 start_codon:yes stop_codon:yes gene_type:complete